MSIFSFPFESRPRVVTHTEGPSMTKQCFKAECDINNILRKYKKNMGIDFLNSFQGYLSGKFGDVSCAPDYHTALGQISEARAVFEAMPAKLRARFDNDPGLCMDFMSDSKNHDEALALGLLKPKVGPSPSVPSSEAPIPVPPAG